MTDAKVPKRPRMPRKDVVRLGNEIYMRDILPKAKDDRFGEYAAIDVESGDWEIAESTMDAADRLKERRPEAVNVMFERIGYRALSSFGGGSRSLIEDHAENSQKDSQTMTNAKAPTGPTMPIQEIARLGDEIYMRDILPKAKDDHFGEYAAIDVESGDWEIAEKELDALDRLKERRPDAVNVMFEHIGYQTLRSFGDKSRSLIK